MTKSDTTPLAPGDESDNTLEGFWEAFSELAGMSLARSSDARRRAAALELEHAAWSTDAPSARNLRYGCAVLADLFARAGVPELTGVLCEFDRNWFEAIEPERHGFRFERTTTLGHGGTHCPFHFHRLRRAPT